MKKKIKAVCFFSNFVKCFIPSVTIRLMTGFYFEWNNVRFFKRQFGNEFKWCSEKMLARFVSSMEIRTPLLNYPGNLSKDLTETENYHTSVKLFHSVVSHFQEQT